MPRILPLPAAIPAFLLAAASVGRTTTADAQQVDDRADRLRSGVGAMAVPWGTHVAPARQGKAMREGYVTQATLFGRLATLGGRFGALATVSAEPLTLARGELAMGAAGEGYVDRRHPHTVVHELIVTIQPLPARERASVSLGRGFVPFGTDDPMMRPFVSFPLNHHLAQLLERPVAIGAIRTSAAMLEVATFAGVEPMHATDLGAFDRFGDSWSARLTLLPMRGVEAQLSAAAVTSPEMPRGEGRDRLMRSASLRYAGRRLYALAEFARSTERDRGQPGLRHGGALMEIGFPVGGARGAIRLQSVERPEHERLFDPFRTPWPHDGGHLLGVTRWQVASVRLERRARIALLAAYPFLESSLARVSVARDGVFAPDQFYGRSRIFTVGAGARLTFGWHPARMGRYGVALPVAPDPLHHAHQ